MHIDRLAWQVCASAGDRPRSIPAHIDAAFATAVNRIVVPGTPLAAGGFSRQYLRDEITAVIKGRGLTSLDTYLEVARTGRRAPMGRQQRTQVWELMTAWDTEMERRGTVDFADVVLRARDHARLLTEPRYSAAIVDEAQDLSLVGLQLVRSLVNGPRGGDRRNGLLLLGDGAQRIYAGGFKLRQAGVEVRGRTTVLRQNYRNTGEILNAAMAVAGDAEVDDLGEEFRRGDETARTERRGAVPVVVEAADFSAQVDEVARRIARAPRYRPYPPATWQSWCRRTGSSPRSSADCGTLASARRRSTATTASPNELVKVGTYHRGKGLEFKVVFLPCLSQGEFGRAPAEGERGRSRRVTRTRARPSCSSR